MLDTQSYKFISPFEGLNGFEINELLGRQFNSDFDKGHTLMSSDFD